MDRAARKAAAASWKERKPAAGIYAIRCGAAVWVGRTPDLDKIWNRRRFELERGAATDRAMQSAWAAEGPDAFAFEVLERLPDDLGPIGRDTALKARLAHWRAALGAAPI